MKILLSIIFLFVATSVFGYDSPYPIIDRNKQLSQSLLNLTVNDIYSKFSMFVDNYSNQSIAGSKTFTGTQTFSTITYINPHNCRVYLSDNQTNVIDGQWSKVNFNAKSWDSSNEFNTTTSSFVCVSAGYYRVDTSVQLSPAGSYGVSASGLQLYQNGTGVRQVRNIWATTVYPQNHDIHDVLYLESGDTLSVYLWFSFGANQTLASGSNIVYLSVVKISE